MTDGAESDGALVRCETAFGPMLVPRQDRYIGKSLQTYGEWCPAEVTLARNFAKPGAVVVDCGANIGAMALPFARMVGLKGQVFAIEAHPQLAALTATNLTANGMSNAQVMTVAVGRESRGETVEMPALNLGVAWNYGGMGLHTWGARKKGAFRVPVAALDTLLALDRLDYLKMDIEGSELAALEGARALIAHHQPAIYLECDKPDEADSLLAALDGLGYVGYWHRSPLFRVENYRQHSEDIFGNIITIGLICLPKGRKLADAVPATGRADHPKQA